MQYIFFYVIECLLYTTGENAEDFVKTRNPRKASSHLLVQKSQEPQSERGY